MRELSTTSYAVLGLLALRDWTPYEIARQFERGWRLTWPRARSGVYEEPKKLVEHGYATATPSARGSRGRRTIYAITPAGRTALRAWLKEPSAEPRVELEAMVRVIFADQGTKADLIATLTRLRQQVLALQEESIRQGSAYVDDNDGGPFPERLHILMVVGRFIHEYVTMLDRFSEWALEEVSSWPDTKRPHDLTHIRHEMQAQIDLHRRPRRRR